MKRKLLFVFGIVALLASCQKDLTGVEEQTGSDEVTFTSSIGSMTRVTDNSFDSGDEISVFAFDGASTYADNVMYCYNGSIFTSETPIAYGQTKELSFTAIYPYSVDASMTMDFAAAVDQSVDGAYEASDLLVANVSATSEVTPELVFSHTMSSLVVEFVDTAVDVTDAQILISAVVNASCDIAAASYVGNGDVEMVTPAETSTGYQAIVAPQSISTGDLLLTVEVDGNSYEWFATSDYTFVSGYQYSLDVTITEDETIEVTLSAMIEDWNDGGLIDSSFNDSDEELTISLVLTQNDSEAILIDVTPSNDDATYTYGSIPTATFEGYGDTDEERAAGAISYWLRYGGSMSSRLVKGSYTADYSFLSSYYSGTSYSMVAFGMDEAGEEVTTEVYCLSFIVGAGL